MLTFIKAQADSLTATLVDFIVTILLVEGFHCWYVVGTAAGTVSGGITHFSLGRSWVFKAGEGKIQAQALKYLLVWIVYLLLNTGSVFLITRYSGASYIYSKVCVSLLMGVSYNYLLHKKFVFK